MLHNPAFLASPALQVSYLKVGDDGTYSGKLSISFNFKPFTESNLSDMLCHISSIKSRLFLGLTVNVLSGFKKIGIYSFNPSSVNERQLAPSNAVSTTPNSVCTSLEQPIPEGEVQPMLFSPEKEMLFQKRFEEGYDIQDEEYIVWVRINHLERCLSVDSSSSVSATSDANHVKASSSPSRVEQNDVLSDILVQPKPKENSRRKRKADINQKSVCLTDDEELEKWKENESVRRKWPRKRE